MISVSVVVESPPRKFEITPEVPPLVRGWSLLLKGGFGWVSERSDTEALPSRKWCRNKNGKKKQKKGKKKATAVHSDPQTNLRLVEASRRGEVAEVLEAGAEGVRQCEALKQP